MLHAIVRLLGSNSRLHCYCIVLLEMRRTARNVNVSFSSWATNKLTLEVSFKWYRQRVWSKSKPITSQSEREKYSLILTRVLETIETKDIVLLATHACTLYVSMSNLYPPIYVFIRQHVGCCYKGMLHRMSPITRHYRTHLVNQGLRIVHSLFDIPY